MRIGTPAGQRCLPTFSHSLIHPPSRLRRCVSRGLPRAAVALNHARPVYRALRWSQASACKRRRQPTVTATQDSDGKPAQSTASIVADVLRARRQAADNGSDAEMLLDALEVGVQTSVVRSWDTTLGHMDMTGTWQHHPNARRMAMLAVFQERFYERAKLLYQAMQHVAERSPGYIAQQDLQRVYELEKSNMLNPAVEVLGPHQLTQLCVALLPLGQVEQLVEQVVGQVQADLLNQPPYNRGNESRRQQLLQAMDRIRASMLAKAYLARLRLRMADQQRRLGQPQAEGDQAGEGPVPTRAAAAPAAGTARPLPLSWNRGYVVAPPPSPPRSLWQRQEEPQESEEEEAERLHFYLLKDLGGPGLGKVGNAAFRSAPQVAATKPSSGPGVGGSSFFAADAREEFSKLATTLQMCRLLQSVKTPAGVTSDVIRLHRTMMLDAIVSWALASPAIRRERLPTECRHRITMRNRDDAPGAFSRGITLSVSGRALPLLRDACLDRGVAFLAGFSPNVGNPFAEVTEWNYFREAAQVWTRFVEMPAVDTVTLQLKNVIPLGSDIPLGPGGQPEVTLKLAKPEFVAFVAALTEYVAGDLPFSRQNWFPVDGPVRIRKHGGEPLSRAAAAGRGSSGGRQEGVEAVLDVLYVPAGGGQLSFSLNGQHIQALVAMIDDMLLAVPGLMRLPPAPLLVTPQGRGAVLLQRGLTLAGAAAKVAATALLLALPLLAILRPQGMLSTRAATASGLATIATPTLNVTYYDESGAEEGAAHSTAQPSTARRPAQPLNQQLSEADLQGLCEKVKEQVQGKVWIPVRDPHAQTMVMTYQVVVDREGGLLGCSPANLDAVITYQELPLSGIVRGADFAARQTKYLEALSPEALKRGNKGDASKLAPAYVPVPWRALPADGAAVLKLELRPDPLDTTFYTDGKVRVDVAAAAVKVLPWSDEDSIAMWRASGAVLPDAPRQGAAMDSALNGLGSINVQGEGGFSAAGDLSQLFKAAQQWAEQQEQQQQQSGPH